MRDQFTGVAKAAGVGNEFRLALGWIAPQRHQGLDSGALQLVEDAVDLLAGMPDAGQMGHGRKSQIALDLLAQFQRLGARGATGPVGHRHEIEGKTSRAFQGGAQIGPTLVRLGREEFEGESWPLGRWDRQSHRHIIIS